MTGFLALIRYVAVRHLVEAKLRTLLVVFGVALGVAMVVGTTAANGAILGAFDELVDRAAGKADVEIVADESGVDQALVEAISERHDLAAHVAGRIEQTTILADGTRILVLGVDLLGDLEFLPFLTDEGKDPFKDALAFVNDPHAILITDGLARSKALGPGRALSLRTAHGVEEMHIEAILRETGASRAFGGQLAILQLDAAQLAFAREGKVDRIDVSFPPGADFEVARRALQDFVGARGKVDRPSRRAQSLARMTAAFTGGLQVTAVIAVLVGMFLVYNAVGVAVAQRRREIGILRSLGASRRSVVLVFLGEAVLVGVVGGVLGVALGHLLAKSVVAQFAPNVSRFFENIATPSVGLSRRLALGGVALGVVSSVVSAWWPARRAAEVSPIEALRRAPPDQSAFRRRALPWIALALLVLAVVVVQRPSANTGLVALLAIFLAATALAPSAVMLVARAAPYVQELLGISARMGIEAIGRAVPRSARTVSALTLATALGLTISAYTSSYERTCLAWVEQAIPADVVVTAGSPLMDRNALAFAPTAAADVSGVEGVAAVNLVRSLSVRYSAPSAELRIEVASLETALYFDRIGEARQVMRGPKRIPRDALEREPAILISENFAWKTGLDVGAFVELPSPSGPHRFRVVAVVADYSNDQGFLLVDRRWMLEYWKDARVETIWVYAKSGVDAAILATAIRTRLASAGEAGLFVTTNVALKREVIAVIEQTFGISRAAEAIAFIVAVLGVVGTMIAAVLDRGHELSVLRAVGATRRQIVVMVVAEAAALGTCAALLAIFAAIPASKVFVDVLAFQASGWSVPLAIPALGFARVGLLVVLLAAFAGFVPAIRASRHVLGRALAGE